MFSDTANVWAISWSLLPGWYGDGRGRIGLGSDGVLTWVVGELTTGSL
jgi:hypothetical protein